MKMAQCILTIMASVFSSCADGVTIDPVSAISLFLELPLKTNSLLGTGFIVTNNGVNYLISNWHVISGRNWPSTNPVSPDGVVPKIVNIFCHRPNLNEFKVVTANLYDSNGAALWVEHPRGGTNVDVVALPLAGIDDSVKVYPLDLNLADANYKVSPSSSVSIIGFPGGFSAPGEFPIWKTGHLATDLDLNYKGMPIALVDVIVRPGMSGSPVIARAFGTYPGLHGDQFVGATCDRFIGVFSADNQSQELAFIWKAEVVREILTSAAQKAR